MVKEVPKTERKNILYIYIYIFSLYFSVEAHGNPYLKESNIFMEPTLIDALCRSDDFVILTASLKLKAVFSFFFFIYFLLFYMP
jgi:hypothetical protein